MFAYLLKAEECAMERICSIGTVVYRSRVSKVVGVQAPTDIAEQLQAIPGVSDVMRDIPNGQLGV